MRGIKIGILGRSGMLGAMLTDYFKANSQYELTTTSRDKKVVQPGERYFEVEEFINNPDKFNWLKKLDYLINAIGVIKPYCQDDDIDGVRRAIKVNTLFPHVLAQYLKGSARIIQIATDCVYSGTVGGYKEDSPHDAQDVYGKTKSLGEVLGEDHFLNIRCSLIGPERKNNLSLLGWFLNQKLGSQVSGFAHHRWNGVTTLQFARLCHAIVRERLFGDLVKASQVHHFVPNPTITKHELLCTFQEIFKTNYRIKKVNNVGQPIDRSLRTRYKLLSQVTEKKDIYEVIKELADYMKQSKMFNG